MPRIPRGRVSLSVQALRFALPLILACGAPAQQTVGRSDREPDERPLEMAVRTPGGDWIHMGDLRGRPLLLFLFATFDGVSQASLRPLSRFARAHPDVYVVGIAVQPNAGPLVDAYAAALDPPFPLAFDPSEDVVGSTSPLGSIDSVPRFMMFDANGFKVEEHVGFPNSRTFENMRENALARAGTREQPDMPLMGE